MPPKTLAINVWLRSATADLKTANIDSARLDAEIILAHTLHKSRTYLHAHGDDSLGARTEEIANARLTLRLDHVPIAYIIGHKEFYGRHFKVTTATLIPRPESETIIDTLKDLVPANQPLFNEKTKHLVDVGTGCGNLGITAKLEMPELDVTLLDTSSQALKVAQDNAKLLGANVQFIKSDLLANYPFKPDIIIANLPYVDPSWERSLETKYEPESALLADKGGVVLINKLIIQAYVNIEAGGLLILEADPVQHQSIVDFAKQAGFSLLKKDGYSIAFRQN